MSGAPPGPPPDRKGWETVIVLLVLMAPWLAMLAFIFAVWLLTS